MNRFALKIVMGALLAGAAIPAYAADILVEEPVEVVPVAAGGWYMRGYIGMSNQYFDQLSSDLYDVPFEFSWIDEGSFSAAPIFGGGLGYQFNDYFRADATIEWRGNSDFDALDRVQWTEESAPYNNDYSAKKSELALMANAYWDIGTFSGITPYVGAGLGASYNRITSFQDNNAQGEGGGYADDNGEWNLAWALHAGLGYKISDRATIDFGYSFMSLGDAKTKQLVNYVEDITPANDGVKFNDIYSHDFKIGIRYGFN